MRRLITLLILIGIFSCTTSKVITEYKEKVVHDSIVKTDTIYKEYHIKGDTIFKNDTLINIDTIIKYRTINIDTLKAYGKFANCEGGVTNSKPFLNLYEDDINIQIESYNKIIKVKDVIIKELSNKIENTKHKLFIQDVWFWLFIVSVLVVFLLIKFK